MYVPQGPAYAYAFTATFSKLFLCSVSLESETKQLLLLLGLNHINYNEDLCTLDDCFAGTEVRNLHSEPNGTARRHNTGPPREWSINIKG